MMKNYILNGRQFQFQDGDVPAGAIPATVAPVKAEAKSVVEKAVEPKNKAVTAPKNKSKKPVKK